ncbi:MAG: prolyl-tRNA synthetase associated domain-containing protein [Chloroflexi bacterium]|nr:prolyl-tRNA synthetase associated domain-containing protein [Chloroflexota bacterium]
MIASESEFLEFLRINRFVFERFEHPAVFTCEEADRYRPNRPSVGTKNLFLCDKKGRRFFLAVTACGKPLKMSELAAKIGVNQLRFASEENLTRLLGVTRGAVTMMGLVNDKERKVELWIDREIWEGEFFQSHPLVNTATLVIGKSELERFFALTGHIPRFF